MTSHSPLTLPKPWSDTLIEFTSNQIPIHLIDLQTLRLVSRYDIAAFYRPILAAYLDKHSSNRTASQYDITRVVFKIVKYAIFSHRWLDEGEPSYRDMDVVRKFSGVTEEAQLSALESQVPDSSARGGLHKLLMFCSKARAYGCRFAWSDTCCINKESSAELDESIRSMFRWYHNAFICIVHLGGSVTIDDVASDEWFTRGWTLQELLAPENIKFFNKDWSPLTGTKNDKDRRNGMLDRADKNPIWRSILSATKIPEGRLGYFSPGAFDVAQRMAWAAGRRTTRVEDMSYALVGIFGVSMPVQYGEGKFAFHRLMEALLQRVNEYGILAWAGPASLHSAALPASLEGYRLAKGIEDCVSVPNEFGDPAMMLTHKGLQVEVLLVPMQSREDEVEGEDSEEDWDDEVSLEEKQGSEPFVPIQNCEEGDSKENEDKGSSAEEEEDSDEADSISATNRDPAPDEADSGSTTDSDSLSVRFLGNDRDQIGGEGPLNQFTLVDEQDNFYTVRVSGRGPIILRGDFVEEIPHQYALAILDYHRDWERGSGCVYVPYEEKSRYLAFVLYRDHVGEVWSKLETDDVVYVEVQPTKRYEGQTVNLCF